MKRTVPLLAALAAATLAPPLAAQAPAPSTAALIEKLAEVPDWLKQLEAIIGPVERNPAVWEEAVGPLRRERAQGPLEFLDLAFAIDFYHQDPREQTDVRLASWSLRFRGEREAALAVLAERFGAGQPLAFAVGQPRRFGDLYLTPLPGERFELAWYDEEPAWAVPPRSGVEERAIEDRLIAFLRAGIRDETLATHFPGFARRPGYSTLEAIGPHTRVEIPEEREGRPDWVSIEIRGDALPAARLVAGLGLRQPGFIARDVHMSYPELCDLVTGKAATRDGYEINVTIHPSLMKSAPSQRPAQLTWTVEDWRIRRLWLRRIDRR